MDAYYIPSDLDAFTAYQLLEYGLGEKDRLHLKRQPFTLTERISSELEHILQTPIERRAASIITSGFNTLHAWYAYNLADEYRASFSRAAHQQTISLRERMPIESAESLIRLMDSYFRVISSFHSAAPIVYNVGRMYLTRLS